MVIEVWSKEGDVIENLPRARQGKIKGWVNIMKEAAAQMKLFKRSDV
ncbi:hypothetical protein CGLO_14658 [Colletotrichum gloeosporioides Cg-14]|uniref:Uncharacterized protein n=1 Tax=Colletotrichum gloeosporioides (strain Cg-14) TaxID=1237896 RepID=T0L3S5_COLGC|nr:hypothetical protein CGLO_14658 [Colletotrichum gloeosporioides Cg-14]